MDGRMSMGLGEVGRAVPPAAGELLWCCVTLAPLMAWHDRFASWLDEAENARAKRFVFEADRVRFVLAHGLLRGVLAAHTVRPPESLALDTSPHGKPALREPAWRHLRFNLSHAGDKVMIGLAHEREVGVDVEVIKTGIAAEGIAERFFTPAEAAAIQAEPASGRDAHFTQCWVRKEAAIKAWGKGLAIDLGRFSVVGAQGLSSMIDAPAESSASDRRWWLSDVEVGDGYRAAVVVEGGAVALRRFDWPVVGGDETPASA